MSNFQTFTGSSRRPRNVNLSGQPSNANPFAQAFGQWPGNPARTVNRAQADRQQRHLDRKRYEAARRIQKAYRAHRARELGRRYGRERFDRITSQSPATRVHEGLPILLCFYRDKNPGDGRRLRALLDDILLSGTSTLSFLSARQASQLVQILLDFLAATSVSDPQRLSLLDLVNSVILTKSDAVGRVAEYYYKCLLRVHAARGAASDQSWIKVTARAALAPLQALRLQKSNDAATSAAAAIYHAFAFDYLTGPDLTSFESNCADFSQSVDLNDLSYIISKSHADQLAKLDEGSDALLWLLAHFIQLCSNSQSYQAAAVLECLYLQIGGLGRDIRRRYAVAKPSGENQPLHKRAWPNPLKPYVRQQLDELVSKDSVQNLLNQLSVKGQAKDTMNLLAGYLLALIRVFPGASDDIRMLIYQCDMPSAGAEYPIVQHFWELSTTTSIYRETLRDDKAPVRLLREYLSGQSQPVNSERESEWRVILLFLELYNFTLRVAGDDDFKSGINHDPLLAPSPHGRPRLQLCCLSLDAVSTLSVFLKKLSFALYHDAKAIANDAGNPNAPKGAAAASSCSLSTEATTRMDLDGLKSIIATTMQLIYERDSRLRFLPASHWLMTSRFQMDNFIDNVVQEWHRTKEADELAQSDEDGDEATQSDDDDAHDGERRQLSSWRHRLQRERDKSLRAYTLATVGPKLEILRHMPFTIPFETRAKIFKQFVHLDKVMRRDGTVEADMWRQMIMPQLARKHHGRIQRGRVFEDAYSEFYTLADGLKEPIYITFLNHFGQVEAGIDGGGVTKEFLISVISEAFGDDQPWFTRNAQGKYYPNPGINGWHQEMRKRPGADDVALATQQMQALQKLEFLGRLVGKCLYEGILIDVTFAGFFVMRWRAEGDKEYKCTINDLRDADEDLYKGLIRLKNAADDVSEWGMYFTITDELRFGKDRETIHITRNLLPEGDMVPVTNENRLLFIALTAQHRLVTQPAAETKAFVRGLQTIIDPSWLSMFNQTELQRLVGGDSKEIDLDDLKRNTVYSGLYVVGNDGMLHPTVQLFWKVMEDFEDDQRRDVLKFVTSTPRAPLLGFSQLNPQFAIRDSQDDETRLPSASTCINLLKLPMYTSEATMREKLLLAISSGAGFDLS